MKDKLKLVFRRVAPWIGFPIFYLFTFVMFASWTFPYDKVKDRIVAEFNATQRTSAGGMELSIDEMGSSWFTGVKASGVRLKSFPKDADQPPAELKIDELRARISLLGLLVFNKTVSFSIDGIGGSLSGEYSDRGKRTTAEVEFDGVGLNELPMVAQEVGLPVEGRLFGNVKFDVPEGKTSKASGSVSLEVRDMAVGDGKTKSKTIPLAIPRANIGSLTISGEVKEGQLKLNKLSASGKDIDIQGEGKGVLKDKPAESSLDMLLRFRINDAYRVKSDVTKSLFGAPGSNVPALFEMDAKVKQSKCSDGFFGWRITNPQGKIHADPNCTSLANSAAGKKAR